MLCAWIWFKCAARSESVQRQVGCRNESGGAISLWVVFMTPVAALAAIIAMAGPQRMAAESSLEEAAHDLAVFAVALRDGTGSPQGEIEGFGSGCRKAGEFYDVCVLLLGGETASDGGYLHRDLGYLGINTLEWEGFYSDSLVLPIEREGWPEVTSCKVISGLETRNAVYLALAGRWENAGWAAAQTWPGGVYLGSEAVARLNQHKLPWTNRDCDSAEFSVSPSSNPARTVFDN